MKQLRDIALIILIGTGIGVLYEATALISQARNQLQMATVQLTNISYHIDVAATNLQYTITDLHKAALSQQAYWDKTSAEMYKTTAAARLVLVRTDHSLNDILVPQLAATLKGTESLQTTAAADLTTISGGVIPVMTNLGIASAAAAQTMADPHIRESLANVDVGTAQLVDVARDLDKTAANVANTTTMIEQRVKQVTTPARLSVRIGEALLDYTVKAAQIAAGFFR